MTMTLLTHTIQRYFELTKSDFNLGPSLRTTDYSFDSRRLNVEDPIASNEVILRAMNEISTLSNQLLSLGSFLSR